MSSGDIEFQNRAIDKNVKKVYRHFTVLITPGHMLLGNIYVSEWKRAQKKGPDNLWILNILILSTQICPSLDQKTKYEMGEEVS